MSDSTIDWADRQPLNERLAALDPEQRLELLERGLASRPDDGFLHAHMGRTLLDLERVASAALHLQVARRTEHGDASLPFCLGLVASRRGRIAEACEHMADAIRISMNPDYALVLMGLLFDSDRSGEALRLCERAREHYPDDLRFVDAAARAWLRSGEADVALQTIDRHDDGVNASLAELKYQGLLLKSDPVRASLAWDDYTARRIRSTQDYAEQAELVLDAVPAGPLRAALIEHWKQRLERVTRSDVPGRSAPLRIAMSILVRDEVDIIERNVRFHASVGVSKFVVTDNGSRDGTRECLARLAGEFDLSVIDEPSLTIDQDLWVTRMARRLEAAGGVDWIIHNDADEFWVPNRADLASAISDELRQSGKASAQIGVLACTRRNMLANRDAVARADYEFFHNVHAVHRTVPLQAGEEPWNDTDSNSVARPVMDKVLTRLDGLREVGYGNHEASHALNTASCSRIEVFHYPVRTYDQFQRKVVNYGEALARNTRFSLDSSRHLRHWYARYLEGRLREDYDQIAFSPERLQQLTDDGFVSVDTRLSDLLDPERSGN